VTRSRLLRQWPLSAVIVSAGIWLPGHPAAAASQTLQPMAVAADALRWRDIEGQIYESSFRSSFSYGSSGSVVVEWTDAGQAFGGTLTATSVKPNFAYQIKLVGRAPITSATAPPDPQTDAEGWASWQLGSRGRWWDQTAQWNLSDAELPGALTAGHDVIGYLLMDFFVTDRDGSATKSFLLDSSYHVLWRTDQKTPTSGDSAVVNHTIWRGLWGYGSDPVVEGSTVGVYAEGEPGRPAPGTLVMPYGVYPITLNITEESFHDNMQYPRITRRYGGFWAQVLEGNLTFQMWPLAVRWPR
jgi:hypothetical protein